MTNSGNGIRPERLPIRERRWWYPFGVYTLLGTAAFLIVVTAICVALWREASDPGPYPPLPPLETVARIEATKKVFDKEPEKGPQKIVYDVPSDYWELIYARLLPARYVPRNTLLWQIVGWLQITTKDGRSCNVMVGEGYFRTEQSDQRCKCYVTEDCLKGRGSTSYRGADSLKSVLSKAYAASKHDVD